MASGRFEVIAERWLDIVLRGVTECMCSCPFCGGAESLQFNLDNGLWLCFRCPERGSSEMLVKKLGGSYSEPAVALTSLEDQLLALESLTSRGKDDSPKSLPESLLARYGGPPHEHWTDHRRFSERIIKRWELGYDALNDRLTIPFRNPDGDLGGVIFRRLDDGFPRYMYPKGFDRSGSFHGSWLLDHRGAGGREATLVEGSTDAVRVSQASGNVLAQYGSSIHPRQVRLLRRLGISYVTLFYDYDPAGLKAVKQAASLLEGFVVRSVIWDDTKYCWHKRLCNCGQKHDPLNLGQCPKDKRRYCKCGKIHEPDPGSLRIREIAAMLHGAQLLGRSKWERNTR